jgi:hypothetical protein
MASHQAVLRRQCALLLREHRTVLTFDSAPLPALNAQGSETRLRLGLEPAKETAKLAAGSRTKNGP